MATLSNTAAIALREKAKECTDEAVRLVAETDLGDEQDLKLIVLLVTASQYIAAADRIEKGP